MFGYAPPSAGGLAGSARRRAQLRKNGAAGRDQASVTATSTENSGVTNTGTPKPTPHRPPSGSARECAQLRKNGAAGRDQASVTATSTENSGVTNNPDPQTDPPPTHTRPQPGLSAGRAPRGTRRRRSCRRRGRRPSA